MSNLCDNSDETMCDIDAPLVLILRIKIREANLFVYTNLETRLFFSVAL